MALSDAFTQKGRLICKGPKAHRSLLSRQGVAGMYFSAAVVSTE
jgi:hypothetical protein